MTQMKPSLNNQKENWHTLTPDQVFVALKSQQQGVSAEEAAARLQQFGSYNFV